MYGQCVEQAFDRLSHAAILRALHSKNASGELIKATFQSLNGLMCKVRLGSTVSEWVRQDHGVPQGAPESPAMFVHTTDLIMQELLQQWEQVKQDRFFSVSVGATGERIELSHTMYADDLVIFAKIMTAAQRMLGDVSNAFAVAGLRVNADTCHYILKEGRVAKYKFSALADVLQLQVIS